MKWLLTWMISAALLAACTLSSPLSAGSKPAIKMAPITHMPPQVQKAPAQVREAYQFAAANPDVLAHVPCYCGCGSIGHTSNLACYIKEFKSDGAPVFDDHALGCSLCVDIARDAMRMTGEGNPLDQVRAEIVKMYSQYGPPNQ
jgi:hypothetical protein